MEHKIIHTSEYLLVVDDSEIKEGDWYYLEKVAKIGSDSGAYKCKSKIGAKLNTLSTNCKKIIAHLPINSPILERVDLLPPIEDDVEKLAKEYFGTKIDNSSFEQTKYGFKIGYNKAKETYKYTEEDIKNAYNIGTGYGNPEHSKELNSFIQSLQQPKLPIAFDFIDKIYKVKSGTIQEHKDGVAGYEYYEWVGTYKY